MVMREIRHLAAHAVDGGIGNRLERIRGLDAGIAQIFLRQIKPADACVLVDVAQDIGELQRAAEMMGQRKAGLLRPCRIP
jgi:hypothetical protein